MSDKPPDQREEELRRLQAEVDALKAELNALIQATIRAGFRLPKKFAKGEKCPKNSPS